MVKQLLKWMPPRQVLRLVWEWALGFGEPALTAELARVYEQMGPVAIEQVIAEKEAAVAALRAKVWHEAAAQQVKELEGIRW